MSMAPSGNFVDAVAVQRCAGISQTGDALGKALASVSYSVVILLNNVLSVSKLVTSLTSFSHCKSPYES
jgi:hypothetical protein